MLYFLAEVGVLLKAACQARRTSCVKRCHHISKKPMIAPSIESSGRI
jgi:hypothetical protein